MTMAEIVPVDEFLDWYPGWKPEHIDEPWLRMKSGPFTKEDESRFWFVDFHWPRGFSPLGFQFVTSAAWSTQLAAHQLPLPPAGGLVQRMGGPFLYESEVPVTSQWEIGYRAARIEKNMPKFLGSFDAIWEERKWGIGDLSVYEIENDKVKRTHPVFKEARKYFERDFHQRFLKKYPGEHDGFTFVSDEDQPGKRNFQFKGRKLEIYLSADNKPNLAPGPHWSAELVATWNLDTARFDKVDFRPGEIEVRPEPE